MKEHIEQRWALVCNEKGYTLKGEFFLGKYCWSMAQGVRGHYNAQQIPTFRTRKLAREAKKELRCYKKSRIVKVEVEIRLVKELKQ